MAATTTTSHALGALRTHQTARHLARPRNAPHHPSRHTSTVRTHRRDEHALVTAALAPVTLDPTSCATSDTPTGSSRMQYLAALAPTVLVRVYDWHSEIGGQGRRAYHVAGSIFHQPRAPQLATRHAATTASQLRIATGVHPPPPAYPRRRPTPLRVHTVLGARSPRPRTTSTAARCRRRPGTRDGDDGLTMPHTLHPATATTALGPRPIRSSGFSSVMSLGYRPLLTAHPDVPSARRCIHAVPRGVHLPPPALRSPRTSTTSTTRHPSDAAAALPWTPQSTLPITAGFRRAGTSQDLDVCATRMRVGHNRTHIHLSSRPPSKTASKVEVKARRKNADVARYPEYGDCAHGVFACKI
ncbi:hypothetical protein DFH06DRAFT_1252285 [Mycena polygramma]|nr:hypothetical protein DFH06DRAFT_1252285 [Mycena polygramma]